MLFVLQVVVRDGL